MSNEELQPINSFNIHDILKSFSSETPLESGVVQLNAGDSNIQGVIRLVQSNPSKCIIDGTIDGLPEGKHKLFIHELGDISQGCDRCVYCSVFMVL